MVKLTLVSPKGNHGVRFFPSSGYLGLTPLKFEGSSYIFVATDTSPHLCLYSGPNRHRAGWKASPYQRYQGVCSVLRVSPRSAGDHTEQYFGRSICHLVEQTRRSRLGRDRKRRIPVPTFHAKPHHCTQLSSLLPRVSDMLADRGWCVFSKHYMARI